jgi:hypothetical protein
MKEGGVLLADIDHRWCGCAHLPFWQQLGLTGEGRQWLSCAHMRWNEIVIRRENDWYK